MASIVFPVESSGLRDKSETAVATVNGESDKGGRDLLDSWCFQDTPTKWHPDYSKARNPDFGYSSDMTPDGTTVICGSPGYWNNDDRPGYVRVYSLEGDIDLGTNNWKQIGQVLDKLAYES